MTVTVLTPEPLTAKNFAPFGDVIDVAGHTPIMINNGNTKRFDSLAHVECFGEETRAVINIFRAQPRTMPMRIRMIEKHPYGSQSFHPLSGQPYLVLVADAVAAPQPEHLHLFLAQANQGINYHANTWHHPVLALNEISDFLVVDRKGKEPNCDEFFFDESLNIEIKLN